MDPNNLDIAGLLSKLKKNVVSVLIIIIAVIVAFNIFKAKQQTLERLKSDINKEEEKNGIIKEVVGLEQDYSLLKKKINTKSNSEILEVFNNFLVQAAIKGASSKALSEVNYPAYSKYPFELVVSVDSYRQIAKFIDLLEKSPDVFIIEELSITSDPEESGSRKIMVKLIVSTVIIK